MGLQKWLVSVDSDSCRSISSRASCGTLFVPSHASVHQHSARATPPHALSRDSQGSEDWDSEGAHTASERVSLDTRALVSGSFPRSRKTAIDRVSPRQRTFYSREMTVRHATHGRLRTRSGTSTSPSLARVLISARRVSVPRHVLGVFNRSRGLATGAVRSLPRVRNLRKFFLLRSSSLRSSLRDKGRPRARRGDVHDEDAHLADVSFH